MFIYRYFMVLLAWTASYAVAQPVRNSTPQPLTIVSASLASDELIYSLVKNHQKTHQVLAYSSLAANPAFSNIADAVPKNLALFDTNMEAILKLKPQTAFLASFNRAEIKNLLVAAGIKLTVLKHFVTWDDIYTNAQQIGEQLHLQKDATKLIKEMKKKLAGLQLTLKKRPTVLNFSQDALLVGNHTLFNEIVTAAGADNLASNIGIDGWQKTSLEKIAQLNPDYLITLQQPAASEQQLAATIKEAPGWRGLPAVKNGRIIYVPQNLMLSTSHFAADAAVLLNKKLREKTGGLISN